MNKDDLCACIFATTGCKCDRKLSVAFVVPLGQLNILLLQKSHQQVQRHQENVCRRYPVCVCVCCASCSLWVLFRSECVSLFACVCVPAALHPCRRANLLATSHSSFPEKEVLSRWQSHDAPLPSRCCNGRRWLQPRRGRKWGICLFLRGRYSAFYFSVPH